MLRISRRAFAAGTASAAALLAQQKKASPKTRVYHDAEIFPAVRGIVANLLMVEEKRVVPTARFVEDLGCDSLDVVEQIMECEDHFGIEISDDDTEKVKTVQDLADEVKIQLRNRKRLLP